MILLDRRRLGALAAAAVSAAALPRPAAAQVGGRLTLYTSQPERDANQTVAAFRRLHPNVEVDIYRSGTTEVMGRVTAEFAAGQPRADVLFVADSVTLEALKRENRLERHSSASIEGFSPQAFDNDRTYFGTKLITTGIAHHRAARSTPTSWTDLMRPELKGQIAMPSPLYSGAAAIMLSVMTQRADLGWGFFEALRANEAIAVRGNGAVLRAVATGEKPYGILVDFMAFNAKQQGSPVEFVFPREGVTAVTEPVGILSTSQNKPAARAFVDFLLSEDGQRLALAQGYLAAREGIGRPAWLPEGQNPQLMAMDMGAVLAATDADKRRFAEMFGAA